MPHRARKPTHIFKCIPRMSWSPANLYNLFQRTYGPPTTETKFMKSSLTMYQQKWKAKQLTRGYHGDWIQENKFKKNYLPDGLPPIVGNLNRNGGGSGKAGEEEERVPLASLMFVEVEKRLDTVVFRCCFADSVARARMMVVHGKVRVNGKIVSDANTKLSPGDLISVDPSSVTTLQPPKPSEYAFKLANQQKNKTISTPSTDSTSSSKIDESSPSTSSSSESTPPTLPTTTTAPIKSSSSKGQPLPFHLPEYASPFLFIPPYIEPSFSTCSAIYLRHPTASPGRSEIPSPYEADGELMRLSGLHYAGMGRKGDKRPDSMRGKRLGA